MMKNPVVGQSAVIDLRPRVVSSPESFVAFKRQLALAGLSSEGLHKDEHLLVGYYHQDEMVGTGAMEIHGDYGLLRSVSVAPLYKGNKWGLKIALHLIGKAKESGLKELFLLTETASGFFNKLGFEATGREQVPPAIRNSKQFVDACPASATCMHLRLGPSCCKS